MRLAGSGATDEDGVALVGDEGSAGQLADQRLVDRRAIELEVLDVLSERQLGDGELVFDRPCLLLGNLGRERSPTIRGGSCWRLMPVAMTSS
jgi:hypothetical protein